MLTPCLRQTSAKTWQLCRNAGLASICKETFFEARYSHNDTAAAAAATERGVIMDSVCYFPICVSKQNGRLVAARYARYLSHFTFLISCAATCAKNNMGTCLWVDPLSDWCRPNTAMLAEYFCEIIAPLPLLCDYRPLGDAERSFGLRRGHSSLYSGSFTPPLLQQSFLLQSCWKEKCWSFTFAHNMNTLIWKLRSFQFKRIT